MVGKRVRRVSVWAEPPRAAVLSVEWSRENGTRGHSLRRDLPPEAVDKVAHIAYASPHGFVRPFLTGPVGWTWELGCPEAAQCVASA